MQAYELTHTPSPTVLGMLQAANERLRGGLGGGKLGLTFDLQEQLRALLERVGGIEDLLQRQGATMSEIRHGFEARTGKLENELHDLKERFDSELPSLRERVDDFEEVLHSLGAEVSDVRNVCEHGLCETHELKDRLDSQFVVLQKRVGVIEDSLPQHIDTCSGEATRARELERLALKFEAIERTQKNVSPTDRGTVMLVQQDDILSLGTVRAGFVPHEGWAIFRENKRSCLSIDSGTSSKTEKKTWCMALKRLDGAIALFVHRQDIVLFAHRTQNVDDLK